MAESVLLALRVADAAPDALAPPVAVAVPGADSVGNGGRVTVGGPAAVADACRTVALRVHTTLGDGAAMPLRVGKGVQVELHSSESRGASVRVTLPAPLWVIGARLGVARSTVAEKLAVSVARARETVAVSGAMTDHELVAEAEGIAWGVGLVVGAPLLVIRGHVAVGGTTAEVVGAWPVGVSGACHVPVTSDVGDAEGGAVTTRVGLRVGVPEAVPRRVRDQDSGGAADEERVAVREGGREGSGEGEGVTVRVARALLRGVRLAVTVAVGAGDIHGVRLSVAVQLRESVVRLVAVGLRTTEAEGDSAPEALEVRWRVALPVTVRPRPGLPELEEVLEA